MLEFSKGTIGLLATAFAMALSGAAEQQKFTGQVTAISPTSIVVSNGKSVKKFRRSVEVAADTAGALPPVHVGDRVTVQYSLAADAVHLDRQSAGREAPGISAPPKEKIPAKESGRAPGYVPGKIDDRAFYET